MLLLSMAPLAGPRSPADGEIELSRPQIQSVLLEWNHKLGPARAGRIADAVLRCERDQGVAPEVVLAVIRVESTARPEVRSPKGAIGLMQVMPHMFDRLDLPGPIAHLETNIAAGCILLEDNIARLGLEDGISAYFWGSRIGGESYLRRVQAVLADLQLEREAEEFGSRG